MAASPSHQFGQIIGDSLESAIEPLLLAFASRHQLFVDKKGHRPARKGKKVSWTDAYGNVHDLDFVLEKNGTSSEIGTPVAFIETAWRRYTKHSRNKAQEIQGAILPLATAYHFAVPFKGAVLAGVFTSGALAQLRSNGFSVLYVPYEKVVKAFSKVKVNASFDEDTSDAEFRAKVRAWKRLPKKEQESVSKWILRYQKKELDVFIDSLEAAVTRYVMLVRILPLFGKPIDCDTVEEAIAIMGSIDKSATKDEIVRYELEMRYSNGDRIQANFLDKNSAIDFLKIYTTPKSASACG